MHRRSFLAAVAAAAATSARSLAQAGPRGPNIIFIMADDLGYGDLGCYGQQTLKTPHIDRLAADGMRCTSVYSGATVCAPSRCSLMTGMHQGHATVRGNKNPEVPLRPDDVTVAEILKQAGYTTALYGKWGVGGPVTSGRPNLQGFDDFYGYLSQWHAHMHFPAHLWQNESERFIAGNFGGRKGAFSHDQFTEKALDFLDNHRSERFFLYLPYAVPHTNNELGRYTGDGMEVPDYLSYGETDWPTPEKGFAAQVEYLDRDVGRIVEKLKQLGIDDDTVIFFTSDNGPHQEGGHRVDFFGSGGPLRGYKRDLYEGGIRVPMVVRWPGHVEAGSTSDEPWAFWDVGATCAELAGVDPPGGIDGLSYLPTLLGRKQSRRHDYLYWEFHERGFKQAVRLGKWKGVRLAPDRATELYDLERDIGETNDIAAQHRDMVDRIEGIFGRARTPSKHFPVRALGEMSA